MKPVPFLAILAAITLGACSTSQEVPVSESAVAVKTTPLTEEAARAVIDGNPGFGSGESTIHMLEWQMTTDDARGLWKIHKSQVSEGLLVEVEILPEGQPYFRSAEYFEGGFIPVTLARPLVRRVVEIQSIRDIEGGSMKEVRFAWNWADVPEVLRRVKPELKDGPRPGVAQLLLQKDGWQIVGSVRDFHTSL